MFRGGRVEYRNRYVPSGTSSKSRHSDCCGAICISMKFILATKESMTRVYGEDGRARAATVLVAEPITVTQVKTKDGKDGYAAIQVGYGVRREKNVSKPVLGHTKGKAYKAIREFRTEDASEVGASIDASVFA